MDRNDCNADAMPASFFDLLVGSARSGQAAGQEASKLNDAFGASKLGPHHHDHASNYIRADTGPAKVH